jgi:N6-L-threonylcarbamoyladenine synthase
MAILLGLESSCDDSAAALVADGHRVIAEAAASQADDFAAWGGVVPEIAARGHILAFPGLVERVLAEAGLGLEAIAAVAVTAYPGLVGSLLTGVSCAKSIAARRGIPLIAVDHIQAHLAAIHLQAPAPTYPLVGLVASGGHSHLYHLTAADTATLLGGTIDDAAGEAFDKCAAILGLGYPGGPVVDQLAEEGEPAAFRLPRSFLGDGTHRLSFAGLKTALLYQVRGPLGRDALTLSPQGVRDACASFRAAVVDVLAPALVGAARALGVSAIAVGGGVACCRLLRRRLAADADAAGLRLHLPAPAHCGDNAAMVAALGWQHLQAGRHVGLDLVPLPTGRAGPRTRRPA